MISVTTTKYHKIDKNGDIVIEKFTSIRKRWGVILRKESHTYTMDGEGTRMSIGFQPETL